MPGIKHYILLLILLISGTFAFAQGEPDEKLAAQYYADGEFDKAVVLYKKLYTEKPTPFFYGYYFNCLVELQEYREAEQVARQQSRKYSMVMNYRVDEGYAQLLDGRNGKADRTFSDLVDYAIDNPNMVRQVSGAFLSRQLSTWAEQTYLNARKRNPQIPYHLELADVYLYSRNYQPMIDELIQFLEQDVANLDLVRRKMTFVLGNDDGTVSDMFRKSLLRKTQKDPEDLVFLELLLWYSLQKKEFELALIQSISLDRREEGQGRRVFDLGSIAMNNGEWDIAIRAYRHLVDQGEDNPFYLTARVNLLDARFAKLKGEVSAEPSFLAQLEKEYDEALAGFGRNNSTVRLILNLAHMQAFYLDKAGEAKKNLEQALEIPNVKPQVRAECKLELADILVMGNDVWEASLLYSQVEKDFKNDVMGHEAKFRNARLSFYIGEFYWSLAQLDVLKAATSKLIANDAMELSLLIRDNIDYDSSTVALERYARADLLYFQNDAGTALLILDSLEKDFAYHPIADAVLMKKGDILLASGEPEKALAAYEQVLASFPEDILADNALWQLARMKDEIFHDSEKAMEYYERILLEYPGSIYTVEARKRYRELKDITSKSNG